MIVSVIILLLGLAALIFGLTGLSIELQLFTEQGTVAGSGVVLTSVSLALALALLVVGWNRLQKARGIPSQQRGVFNSLAAFWLALRQRVMNPQDYMERYRWRSFLLLVVFLFLSFDHFLLLVFFHALYYGVGEYRLGRTYARFIWYRRAEDPFNFWLTLSVRMTIGLGALIMVIGTWFGLFSASEGQVTELLDKTGRGAFLLSVAAV